VRLRARHADGHWLTLEAYSRPLAALAGALLALSLEPVAPGRRRRRDGQPDPPPGRPAQHPVVILSADARPGLIQRLLEQGARGFLTKPLDVRELLEVLDGIAADREQAGRA
jgi:hypothetical protein